MKEKNNILEELDGLSSLLKEIKSKEKNNLPGQVYFNDLQNKVIQEISLEQYKDKRLTNDVPDGYFTKLPAVVFEKLNQNKTKTTRLKPLYKWLGMAAAVIFVLVAVPFISMIFRSSSQKIMASNETNKRVSEWTKTLNEEDMNYIIDNFNSEEVLETIKDLEIPESDIKTTSTSDQFDILTNEEVEYLNELM
jgi:hypothetical protein